MLLVIIGRLFPPGLPGARDGPPVEGDGAARAQQDEPAEPLHLLRPRPHARLRRRRLLRHARQCRFHGAGHAQHLGAHPGSQVPHRDLAQGARVNRWVMGGYRNGRYAGGFFSGAWTTKTWMTARSARTGHAGNNRASRNDGS